MVTVQAQAYPVEFPKGALFHRARAKAKEKDVGLFLKNLLKGIYRYADKATILRIIGKDLPI